MNKNLGFSLLGCMIVQFLSACGASKNDKLPAPEVCLVSATPSEKCSRNEPGGGPSVADDGQDKTDSADRSVDLAVEKTREEIMWQLSVKTWSEALIKAPAVEQLSFNRYFAVDGNTLAPFINLKRLYAGNGTLNSISFVGSLAHLEELDINFGDVEDVRKGFSLPGKVTKLTVRNASQLEFGILTQQADLKFLRLVGSFNINDWSGLKKLTKIESLSIQMASKAGHDDHTIESLVKVLPDMKSLQTVNLDAFSLQSRWVGPTPQSTQERRSLVKIVNALPTTVRDLSLTANGLSETEVESINLSARFSQLETLNIDLNDSGFFAVVKSAPPSLRTFNARGMGYLFGDGTKRLTDISSLPSTLTLETLDLGANKLDDNDFESLPPATQGTLKNLLLDGNDFKSVSKIGAFAQLQSLDLHKETGYMLMGMYYGDPYTGNAIVSLAGLGNLTNVNELILDGNPFDDLAPLKKLAALEYLRLDWTNVKDLTPVQDMKMLSTLLVRDTKLEDISVLSGLPEIKSLDLGKTKVTDLSPLTKLAKITTFNSEKLAIAKDKCPLNAESAAVKTFCGSL